MQYPTAETKLRCLQHYLQRKEIECNVALSSPRERIMEDLQCGKASYEESMGVDGVAHLQLWQEVLDQTLS